MWIFPLRLAFSETSRDKQGLGIRMEFRDLGRVPELHRDPHIDKENKWGDN